MVVLILVGMRILIGLIFYTEKRRRFNYEKGRNAKANGNYEAGKRVL